MSTPLEQTEQVQLPHDEREVVLRVNFDDRDHDDCVYASLRFMRGPRHPHAGEWVYLLDDHGRGCLGRVESVRGWAARIVPQWAELTGGVDLGPPAETL
ncbi:MAG: hypothetical protein ACJ76V_13535 [Thermoleophilaceae bacterium]